MSAAQAIREIQEGGAWADPIVTQLVPLETFYPAEEYHQDYFRKNPAQAYCRAVIAPKVTKFRQKYLGKLRKSSPDSTQDNTVKWRNA